MLRHSQESAYNNGIISRVPLIIDTIQPWPNHIHHPGSPQHHTTPIKIQTAAGSMSQSISTTVGNLFECLWKGTAPVSSVEQTLNNSVEENAKLRTKVYKAEFK